MHRVFRLWLLGNDGMPGVLRENRRLDLAAKVAIDAGIIDEEVAGHVLGVGPLSIRHTINCTPTPSWRPPALYGARSLRGCRGPRRRVRRSGAARASAAARRRRRRDDAASP